MIRLTTDSNTCHHCQSHYYRDYYYAVYMLLNTLHYTCSIVPQCSVEFSRTTSIYFFQSFSPSLLSSKYGAVQMEDDWQEAVTQRQPAEGCLGKKRSIALKTEPGVPTSEGTGAPTTVETLSGSAVIDLLLHSPEQNSIASKRHRGWMPARQSGK